jgi:hypothetical protein
VIEIIPTVFFNSGVKPWAIFVLFAVAVPAFARIICNSDIAFAV